MIDSWNFYLHIHRYLFCESLLLSQGYFYMNVFIKKKKKKPKQKQRLGCVKSRKSHVIYHPLQTGVCVKAVKRVKGDLLHVKGSVNVIKMPLFQCFCSDKIGWCRVSLEVCLWLRLSGRLSVVGTFDPTLSVSEQPCDILLWHKKKNKKTTACPRSRPHAPME